MQFTDVPAREILDSRGCPTLSMAIASGEDRAVASVPSGASTGSNEAHELRDGDPTRYGGASVLKAGGSVNAELRDLLCGHTWTGLAALDLAMIELDGTANRSRLGANAIVGVSVAAARLFADRAEVPLWR